MRILKLLRYWKIQKGKYFACHKHLNLPRLLVMRRPQPQIMCMSNKLIQQYFNPNISGYFEGIVGNLQLMPIHYPGWVIRLYHDIRSDDPVMQVHFVFESSYQNRNYQFTCWCL